MREKSATALRVDFNNKFTAVLFYVANVTHSFLGERLIISFDGCDHETSPVLHSDTTSVTSVAGENHVDYCLFLLIQLSNLFIIA